MDRLYASPFLHDARPRATLLERIGLPLRFPHCCPLLTRLSSISPSRSREETRHGRLLCLRARAPCVRPKSSSSHEASRYPSYRGQGKRLRGNYSHFRTKIHYQMLKRNSRTLPNILILSIYQSRARLAWNQVKRIDIELGLADCTRSIICGPYDRVGVYHLLMSRTLSKLCRQARERHAGGY